MTASAAYYRSPFDIDNRTDYPEIEAGHTIREFLEASGLWDELHKRPIVVSLNNVQLTEARGDYDRVLEEGDRLSLSAMPTEPGSTAYLIFQIFAVVTAVVSVALVLTADEPETGEGDETDSPNQNLNARGNRARMGQPKPVLYGRHRVFPDLSSKPYDEYDRSGDQVVWLLYELTVGECDVELNTARFEDTLLSNFPDTQIEVIPPGATSEVFTNEVVTSTEVSNIEVEATSGGAAVAYAINPPATTITGFSVDLSAPSIYRQRPNSGTFTRYSVSLVVQYREIDDAGAAVGSWTTARTVTLSGSTQKIIQRTDRFTVPEGRYEARIYRTVAKAGTTRIADTVFFEALRGYYADSLPVSASTRIALRIRSSNQIGNRSLTKFSVIATRKLLGISGGQFTGSTSATRSAALAFADICAASYGGKRALSFIDMQKLEALDAQLALEGITFDGVFDSNVNVLPALKRVAQVFQGSPIEKNGIQSFARDIAVSTPVQVYSMENIVRGSFQTQQVGVLAETADHVIIEFFDEDQDYRLTSVACIPPGASTNNPRSVRLFGVTNRDKAWERGMHLAAQNRYRRENVSFETGIEGRIPTYLDLILVSHAVLGVAGTEQKSGRISAFAGSVLDVTEDCTGVFTSPFIAFPKLNGEPVGPYACTVLSETQIQINETFDNSGLDFTPGYELPRFIIGEGSEFATRARVTLVERAGKDRLRIEAFIDAPEVYTVTSGEVPPAAVSLENLLDRLPRVENLQVAGFGSPREPSILITWEGQNADRYDLEYSIDAGVTWIDITDEVLFESRFVDRPDETLTSIRYRVAPLSVYRGDWVEVNVTNIAALIANAAPPPPTGLDVESVSAGVAITVRIADNPNEGIPEAVEIYRVEEPDTLWGGASRVLLDSYPVTPDPVNDRWIAQYIDASAVGDVTYAYFARTVNSFGNSARFPADPGAGVPVTVTAPGSGGTGAPGADAIAASPVIYEWLKAQDGGAWAPVSVTQDAVIRFVRKSVEVSTHTVRATLDPVAGTITVADQGETGEDTNITATSGSGESLVRVEVTHVTSGAIGVITFKAVQGGSVGSPGANGVSGRIGSAVALDYDDADTTGAAVGDGGYAFLTTLDANNTSGTVDWGELTDGSVLALLINDNDVNGFDQSEYLDSLQVGDPFEFVQDPQKWLSFTITSIETHPSGRHKFGVLLVSFDERANQGDLNTAAGNPVTFRFGRVVGGAPGLPGASRILGYDDLNTGAITTADGGYRFVNSIGNGTNNWESITGRGSTPIAELHLSRDDAAGTDQTDYHAAQTVDDVIVWQGSARRWVAFSVDSIISAGSPLACAVSVLAYDEGDGAQNVDTANGVPVSFRFTRAVDGPQGEDGEPGANGRGGAGAVLDYDDLQTTGFTTGGGTYKFSTTTPAETGTEVWSIITSPGGIDAIFLNPLDTSDVDHSNTIYQQQAGDYMTWWKSEILWADFRILGVDFSGDYPRFDVVLAEFRDDAGSGNIPTTAGNAVQWRFSRPPSGASVVNSVGFGWGAMDALPAGTNPGNSVNGVASLVDNASQAFIGSKFIEAEATSGVGAGCYLRGTPGPDWRIPPNRRWIVSAWVFNGAGTRSVQAEMWTSPTGSSADDVSRSAVAPQQKQNPSSVWTRQVWEVDLTAVDDTFATIRLFNASGSVNPLQIGETQRYDAAMLVDVTFMPWITQANAIRLLPSFVAPAEGGPAGDTGDPGVNAASIDLTPAFTQWTQAPNGGAWSPGATTNDILIEARIAGAVVATETWRVTRDTSGDLTVAIQGANDGDINVSVTGSGSSALTLVADFDDGTLQASKSQTITTVKGGTDGGAGSGITEVSVSDQASISGSAAIVHPSQGNAINLSVIGTPFGFAGSQGPASSVLELRNDANTAIASVTVILQWSFESELFTWAWNGTPVNVNIAVVETPGVGNQDYTLSWSAGSAAPFAVGPLLRSVETVNI